MTKIDQHDKNEFRMTETQRMTLLNPVIRIDNLLGILKFSF